MDPQGNTTSGLGVDKNQAENTVYELILDESELSDCIYSSVMENLSVIPSNINLSGAEIELIGFENKEYLLKSKLDMIKDNYDYIIIDCPPSLNIKERLNPKLEIEGVVFTMYDARTNLSLQVVENVKENLDKNIYKTIIPRNVRLAEAPSYGMPINMYDSRSAGAEAYRYLAEEVIEKEDENEWL